MDKRGDNSSGHVFKESWLRNRFRNGFFRLLRKISETDDARAIWTSILKGQLAWQPDFWFNSRHKVFSPYNDLGSPDHTNKTAMRGDVIFITGRFRSGSTLLWNLFRGIEKTTAYYEPFNERRWFDPRTRGNKVDPTHINAAEYWREYDGLELLSEYYCAEWIARHLYMDASFWAPKMKRYVELMIEKAPGRPVLQFNRIDLRLPWFRQNFPNAMIVHLYRHPRDQWCSTLMDLNCFSKNGTMEQFAPHDKFYLGMWAKDLKYHFPFLDAASVSHPYQLFFYIWKLSYMFGSAFAHYSVAFEDLLKNPDEQLTDLLSFCRVENYQIDQLKSLIEKPMIEKWRNYADGVWFQRHESICETTMADFFEGMPSNKRAAERRACEDIINKHGR